MKDGIPQNLLTAGLNPFSFVFNLSNKMFCLIKQIEFHNYNDGIPGVVAIKQMHCISDRSGVRWSMHIFIDFNRTWLSSTLHLKKYLVYLNPLRETAYHVFRCGTSEIHQSFIFWGYSVFMKFLNNMLKVFNVLSYSVRVYATDFNSSLRSMQIWPVVDNF